MKSFLISFLSVLFVVGCSSPPKPPSLQNKKYDIAVNKDFHKRYENKSSKNVDVLKEFKNKSFVYEIYSYPIPESNKLMFTFLASHSHSIKITANEKMINLYRSYLENELNINSSSINTELRLNKFDYVQFIFSGELSK